MRKLRVVAVFGVLGLLMMLAVASPATAHRPATRVFLTTLEGDQEVPPAESDGRGIALFKLNRAGTELRFILIVVRLDEILMAHIHLAPAGVNGPIVVWLYPDSPPPMLIPGRFSGVLARGTITDADLTGPLQGMSLSDLVDEMRAENTYVNVHTTAFPGGEVRGQITPIAPP